MKAAADQTCEFLGLEFSTLNEGDVLALLQNRPDGAAFGYLITPNVDHVVRLHDPHLADKNEVWAAYRGATWRTCDSRVLAFLARVAGVTLPVVTGSDLTRKLLSILESGTPVAVVGGNEQTVPQLRNLFPNIHFSQHRPPMGLRENGGALGLAATFAQDSCARFIFLAVGSPQQELLAREIARRPGANSTALCIGAALDFLTGDELRAPTAMQKVGLEWLFRMGQNPRRLWRRYLLSGPRVVRIWWAWRSDQRRAGHRERNR